MIRPSLCVELALALALPLLSSLAVGQEPAAVQDGDLKPIAEGLAAYLEARASTVGLDEAKAELAGSLATLGKLGEGGHPLRRSAALARALWLSRDYPGAKLRKGKVTSDTFAAGSFGGEGLEYAYRVPREYDPSGSGYPLILAIPDEDETPADHLRDSWSSSQLRDGAIVVCPTMPEERAEWDQVMVNGRPGGLCHVLAALRLAGERFAVDFDRVYVAGRGKGVPAAVAAGNYSPQRFAGIIGRSGDAGELGPENFSNLPTFFAGAGAQATAFQQAAREAGYDNCTLRPTGKEEDAWGWILRSPRRTNPESVTLVVGTPFPTRAYWLRVAPIAPDARAKATIDREANSIRIDGQGISHATLYLNDALIDLDRPVQVLGNDVLETANIARRLSTTLDLLHDGTSDAGCVYVAEVVFSLRPDRAPSAPESVAGRDAELEERLAAASADVAKLWELHEWCCTTERLAESERILQRILRLAPDHAAARQALGHAGAAGRWFPSTGTLERFQRGQDEEIAKARGYVKHQEVWMHPDERALAGKGLVKNFETGQWTSAADRRRLEKGWARQDLEWISPEEVPNLDDGLWLVDGEWLDSREANQRRSRIDTMWRIPGPEVLLHCTVSRDVAARAAEQMGRALEDLRRVFGAEPRLPLEVAVLRDEEQYDRFAFGDPDGRRLATHVGRLHVVHTAFFAESWFPRSGGKPRFAGMGVCYWNADAPYGDNYGVHSARLAVGLSYVDALDPSPKAVRRVLSRGPSPEYYAAYQAEKKLPAWLRYGGAVYAERYFRDPAVAADGDAWWARAWSIDNLKSRGGMRPLAEVLEFPLDPEDREDGLKLYLEAGLLVAFIVDGECAPVTEAHQALKSALVAGRVQPRHLTALTEAVTAHQAELKTFAGL